MTIGERIKSKRIELGMSQDELAKKCGYKSRSSINKIELARDLPLNKISLMANALDVEPAYLMGWYDELKEKAEATAKLFNDDGDMAKLINIWEQLNEQNKINVLDFAGFCLSRQKEN